MASCNMMFEKLESFNLNSCHEKLASFDFIHSQFHHTQLGHCPMDRKEEVVHWLN